MAPERRKLAPLLDRLDQQSKFTARPSGCMPVFDALLLDELLTRLRRIADNKVAFVSPSDELAALRTLSAEQLWEINRQMLLHLDDMTSSLKQHVGAEDVPLLERAVGLTHRRQGWHYLVAQEESGSILVSLDQQHVLQVLGTHETLLEAARRQTHRQVELPLLLFVTLLPLKTRDEGWVIAHDGLIAYLTLPDPERQTLGAQLRRRYDEARNTPQVGDSLTLKAHPHPNSHPNPSPNPTPNSKPNPSSNARRSLPSQRTQRRGSSGCQRSRQRSPLRCRLLVRVRVRAHPHPNPNPIPNPNPSPSPSPSPNPNQVPPPSSRDTLAGTRALVRTIPTRLTLHPTLKDRLVPHPLVQYEESEAWPGRRTDAVAALRGIGRTLKPVDTAAALGSGSTTRGHPCHRNGPGRFPSSWAVAPAPSKPPASPPMAAPRLRVGAPTRSQVRRAQRGSQGRHG